MPAAHGLGAVICFEGEFHAARDATKTHTSRTDTFRSGEHGKLGEVDEGVVTVHRRPALRRVFAPERIETEIELVKLSMGTSDRLLRAAAAGGARAIVLEAFGRGNPTPAITQAIAAIVRSGTPVIVCSRCPEGRVKPIYGHGGGKDAERAGAIFAGELAGVKARLLAAVRLGEGRTALRRANARLRRGESRPIYGPSQPEFIADDWSVPCSSKPETRSRPATRPEPGRDGGRRSSTG